MTARNKYGAQKTTYFGITFDSKAEAAHYLKLLEREQAGEITNLETQPRYRVWDGIDAKGKHQHIDYIGDFRYIENGRTVVEDVKGGRTTQTAVFRIKAKMFRCRYPDIDFRVVGKGAK